MPNHRVHLIIDEHSFLDTYHQDEVKSVIIFIHGILGDYKETWNSTPSTMKGERTLSSFDFGSFGYNTDILDFRKPDAAAIQLILWKRAHLAKYENIFIVAHSMGGLIVRMACDLLVRSEHDDDLSLLSKIKHCFFVAVPVSGSWAAQLLAAFPYLKQLNHKLPFLARPTINGQDLSEHYRQAIVLAKQRGLARPKFSHFVGMKDKVVDAPGEQDLTEDDRFEGYVDGDHNSIKSDMTENSTLIRRIIQVVTKCTAPQPVPATLSSYNNTLALPLARTHLSIPPRRRAAANKGTRDILIIPCSATKESREGDLHPRTGGIQNGLTDPRLIAKVFETRVRIRTLIESGVLEGGEFKEGNRVLGRQNKKLYLGPDFGTDVNKARFLPANQRYLGRCYQASTEEWRQFFALDESERPDILIVSGLYGLFPADEYIQSYDVHLTDLDLSQQRTVQSYWHDILTEVLFSRLDWIEQRGYKIGRVFDLLTEDLYRAVLNWPQIYERCTVLHQAFEKRRGREALDNTGIWLRKLIISPNSLSEIEPDQFYRDAEFLHQDCCVFKTGSETNAITEA